MSRFLSHTLIVLDIASMKAFLWLLGQLFTWAADPNSGILDSHLFFYDRYSDLAEYHHFSGQTAKAERFAAIAEAYYQAAPDDDDEPEAAAMSMPVPRPIKTNAVSSPRRLAPGRVQPQIGTILPHLAGVQGVSDVTNVLHEELVCWFDHRVGGPKNAYEPAAHRIWAAIFEYRDVVE